MRRIDWRTAGRALAAFAILACLLGTTVRADEGGVVRVLFNQQDAVQAFTLDPSTGTGTGFQIGTATGLISGTSYVQFNFNIAGPPTSATTFPIAFHNKVIITDIDGDQLLFDNNGTGSFHFASDNTFTGTGGPLTGTYVLTKATGKYAGWKVGSSYDYRAIATNPPSPPATFGNVFVQVTYHDHDPK